MAQAVFLNFLFFTESLRLKFYPQLVLTVERFSVDRIFRNFIPQCLLKSSELCTLACGWIQAAALREKPLIHITFL